MEGSQLRVYTEGYIPNATRDCKILSKSQDIFALGQVALELLLPELNVATSSTEDPNFAQLLTALVTLMCVTLSLFFLYFYICTRPWELCNVIMTCLKLPWSADQLLERFGYLWTEAWEYSKIYEYYSKLQRESVTVSSNGSSAPNEENTSTSALHVPIPQLDPKETNKICTPLERVFNEVELGVDKVDTTLKKRGAKSFAERTSTLESAIAEKNKTLNTRTKKKIQVVIDKLLAEKEKADTIKQEKTVLTETQTKKVLQNGDAEQKAVQVLPSKKNKENITKTVTKKQLKR